MRNKSVTLRNGLALLLLMLSGIAAACMWDTDTLGDEARNHGNVVDVITGRFPRNPPLYYEMRLERVTREVVSNPENLDLYDDGGVACDRLNRGEEALQWMARKREQLENAEDSAKTKDHWYRYHANLGTFQAHQWFRDGAITTATALLEKGADNIAKAIEINPDAHFGREQYQLDLMRWLISKPEPLYYEGDYIRGPATFLNDLLYREDPRQSLTKQRLEKASEGLLGLIYLGNAWESVDVFYTLALIHGKLQNASIQELCMARVRELLDGGKLPILAPMLAANDLEEFKMASVSHGEPKVTIPVKDLRKSADKWQKHRTDYLIERLNAGRHPDTDKSFWKDYKEIPAMRLPKGVINGTSAKISLLDKYKFPIMACGLLVSWLLIRNLVKFAWRKKNGAGDRT